jgi:hypothetical protein
MMRQLTVIFVIINIFSYCTHRTTLSEQIKLNLSTHIKKIDTALVLDSFKIYRIDTMVERLGRIIDDTIYKRELYRVQLQLANAVKEQKQDSIAIYQEEVNYMSPQIDSITKSISKGDTTKKYGIVVECSFNLKKNNASDKGIAYYFLDNNMNIINPDIIDSFIYRTYTRIK